jgi:hypothetical protein
MKSVRVGDSYINIEQIISIDINEENEWARLNLQGEPSVSIKLGDLDKLLKFCYISLLELDQWTYTH